MTVATNIHERISKCQKILEIDPNSQIFAALAEAYRKKGELDKAFRICQNGLKIHPSYGSAHVVMAKINLDRGLFDWAEAEVNRAIEIEGKSRAIELLLAEIFIYRGDFRSAVRLLKQLNESDPDNTQIKKLLEIARKIPEEQTVMMTAAQSQEESKTPTADTSSPNAPAKEEPKFSTRDIIETALSITEVLGVLFANEEGLVIESEWTLAVDSVICGATMSEVGNLLDRELAANSFGKVDTVLIETTGSVFYIVKVVNGLFVLAGSSKVNLGSLRMKMTQMISRYQAS